MKYIAIILILLSLPGYGQSVETLEMRYDTINAELVHPDSRYWVRPQSKLDTIQCLMLASDTSEINGWRSLTPIYIKGYEVIDRPDNKFVHYDHICYLDQNKKPLSKSIIIWMTK